MIDRYAHGQLAHLTGNGKRLQYWLQVERAVAVAGVLDGLVPDELPDLLGRASVDWWAVQRMERETGHDVLAFVRVLENEIGPPLGKWVHYGATSSDIVDTGLALMLRDAARVLNEQRDRLVGALCRRGLGWRERPRLARTHGQAAQITSAGRRLVGLAWELAQGQFPSLPGRIAGPVGDFPILSESSVVEALGRIELGSDAFGTQITNRAYHLAWAQTLSRIATGVEALATWARLETISGVDQVSLEHPVGSSSMPHKRNPTAAETLCGLARLVRHNVRALEDSVVTWGDRDISHSSVERVALADAIQLTGTLLVRAAELVDELRWNIRAAVGPDSFQRLHAAVRHPSTKTRAQAHELVTGQGEHASKSDPLPGIDGFGWTWAQTQARIAAARGRVSPPVGRG